MNDNQRAAERITGALSDPEWHPRRHHIEGARNQLVEAAAEIERLLGVCKDKTELLTAAYEQIERLRALPPLRAREEIARTLYKSRGQFDDATVKLHFDWYLAQQGKPLAVRENPDARMAIVHCYRDADAVLALSGTAGQEWRDISSAPSDSPDLYIDVVGGRYTRPTTVLADGDYWRHQKKIGSTAIPTHWMPRPAPPVAEPLLAEKREKS